MAKNKKEKDTTQPGLLERMGVQYWQRMSRTDATRSTMPGSEPQLVRTANYIAWVGILWCFVAGGISAWGSVYADQTIPDSVGFYTKYAYVIGVTLVLTAFEFGILFWLGLRTVFYITRVSGLDLRENFGNDTIVAQVPNIMARAAMEVPDPVQKYLGIDPLARVNKTRLLLVGLFYKVKVFLTNFTARTLLKFVVGKSVVRVSVDYIAVPITGLWNAVVMWLIIREARLRIFGGLLAKQVTEDILNEGMLMTMDPRTRECLVRAAANTIVLTQNYHPNMLILVVRIHEALGKPHIEEPDSWERFVQQLHSLPAGERLYVMDLLAVAAALDGRLSRLEKDRLDEAFAEHTKVYYDRIKKMTCYMRQGRIHSVRQLADLDTVAG